MSYWPTIIVSSGAASAIFCTEAGDIEVVAEAESGGQAFALAIEHRPDVVILDIRMPDESGLEVARRLRSGGSTIVILLLTAFDDPPYIRAALDIGANGYVLKSSDADEIVDAVRAVHEGKQVFDSVLNIPRPRLKRKTLLPST